MKHEFFLAMKLFVGVEAVLIGLLIFMATR